MFCNYSVRDSTASDVNVESLSPKPTLNFVQELLIVLPASRSKRKKNVHKKEIAICKYDSGSGKIKERFGRDLCSFFSFFLWLVLIRIEI